MRSEQDERSVLLALTPAGRQIGVRIMTQLHDTMDALLAAWSPADVADLRRLLARLARETVR